MPPPRLRTAAGLAGSTLVAAFMLLASPPPALAGPSYIDVGRGEFGSMSWAGWAGLGSFARYGGAPYALSADVSWSHPSDSEYARGSSSLLGGDLHALADAGSCQTTGTVDLCGAYRTVMFAGSAIWDTLSFEGGEPTQRISPRLHIDGASLGSGYGRVRHYVGLSRDPVGELNRLPGHGWTILSGTNVDLTIDLADFVLGFPVGWTVFIELEASATEGFGGNVADFGNTARFEWELPAGVGVRSASGQFMAGVPAAVPAPSPLGMALAGFGLLALTTAHRAQKSP